MIPSLPYKPVYRSEIDGLRAFAVLSVVAFHVFPNWLKGGFIGVDIFFVISGFLITTHIFENLDKGQFSFADFFGRRIRRIFPALIVVMVCSLIFGWFALFAHEYAQLGKHVASGAAFVINFIFVDESGYFDNAAMTKPMLHLWSLAVEEQFYIIWPLVLWVAWKRKVNLLKTTFVVAAVSLYLNLHFVKSDPSETFFWPLGRFWELLSGSILAWLLLYKHEYLGKLRLWINRFLLRLFSLKDKTAGSSTVSNLMSFFGLLILFYGVTRINDTLPFPSIWALIPVTGALLVIAGGSESWLNRMFLMNPIATWFGLISYPLYLWHWPILSFLQIIEGEVPNGGARVLAVILAVFFAWLTFKFIENPIRKQKKMAPKAKHLSMLLCLIGVSAFFVNKFDGIPSRTAVFELNLNLDELQRTVEKEDRCLKFLGISDSKFNYCRVGNIGTKGVVAIIGDSHAHTAFPGISEGLFELGYTVILMANSSCPPLIGAPWGRTENEKQWCRERIAQIISKTKSLEGLNSVIMFTRGPSYWLGNEPSSPQTKKPHINLEGYFSGLQRTLDALSAYSPKVIYVSENPELRYQAISCLPRPFNAKVSKKCEQPLEGVLNRQRDYRKQLNNLKKVIVLDSTKAFCNRNKKVCFAVSPQNKLLYADDNHISVNGSNRQYQQLIKPLYQGKVDM